MERTHPYVIADHQPPDGFHYWITYYPGPNHMQTEQLVGLTYGHDRCKPQGPCLEPDRMLEWTPHIFYDKPVDGKLWEPRSAGWFRRQCEDSGCLWFYAIVERMATGEDVSLEEIKEAYRINNGGRELEQRPIRELL